MSHTILIIDDNNSLSLKGFLEESGYEAIIMDNGKDACDLLMSSTTPPIDIILLDLMLPDMNGMDLLHTIRPVHPHIPVIIHTDCDDITLAVRSMKEGANDFIHKDEAPEMLNTSIEKALHSRELQNELCRLQHTLRGQTAFTRIIRKSDAMESIITLGKKAAESHIPVYIQGESGVGKELLAQAIHQASNRADQPFVAVNCGAIPEHLVESILFGHEKGAFTGAINKTYGKFREANGGTLFLDEIGELSQHVQVKLLRAIQEQEIEPVGSKSSVKVNIRLISATNKQLEKQVKAGCFREDLFYRLNVFPITIPPLRDRVTDILPLAKHFLQECSNQEEKTITELSDDTQKMLVDFAWPGNVRQLKNMVSRAVVLCESNELHLSDFPLLTNTEPTDLSAEPYIYNHHTSHGHITLTNQEGHFKPLSDSEATIIMAAMQFYHGHVSEVARRLGISRSTLYRKLEHYNIEP